MEEEDNNNNNGGNNHCNITRVVNIYPLSGYYFGSKQALSLRNETNFDRIQRFKSNYAANGMRTCVEAVMLIELLKHPHLLVLQVRNTFFKLPGGRLRLGESEIEGLKRKLSTKLSPSDEEVDDDWEMLIDPQGNNFKDCVLVRCSSDDEDHLHKILGRKLHTLLKAEYRCKVSVSPNNALKTQVIDKLLTAFLLQLDFPPTNVGECLGMWWRADFDTLLCPHLPLHARSPKECTKLFLVKLPATRKFNVPKNLKLLAVPLSDLHENSKTYGTVISGVPQLLSRFDFNIIRP